MARPCANTFLNVPDGVWLEDMQVSAVVGPDAWRRPGRPQPIEISVKVPFSVSQAGMLDDVTKTVHYGILAKSIMELFKAEAATFASLEELVVAISNKALLEGVKGRSLEIMIVLPEALLLAGGLGLVTYISKIDPPPGIDDETKLKGTELKLFVKDLHLNCIIGVNPHERLEKQPVIVNLEFWRFDKRLLVEYADTIKKVSEVRSRFINSALLTSLIEASSFETLEALVNSIAKILVLRCPVRVATVSAHKTRAITGVKKAGATLTRTRDFYDRQTNGTATPE